MLSRQKIDQRISIPKHKILQTHMKTASKFSYVRQCNLLSAGSQASKQEYKHENSSSACQQWSPQILSL
jgi:hypothetical protein